MSTFSRLTAVYKSSEELILDQDSKLVFFSDVHRGDNSKADNFAPNKDIYKAALNYYYDLGYTYIEIGDGDELWENRHFAELLRSHADVYRLLDKFHIDERFYMIWGNHDMVKKRRTFVYRSARSYARKEPDEPKLLFEGLKVHEGLVLKQKESHNKILVTHGHQGDLLNDYLWFVARFLVRYIWRSIEFLKNKNPVSPASNRSKMLAAEDRIKEWIKFYNIPVIAGHTHQVAFPWPGNIPYFNDGCCIRKAYITGLEITCNEIMLVRWTRNKDRYGMPGSRREILAGPEKIETYFL